jgi:carboxypeptidase D
MLYIDQPISVGFSRGTDNVNSTKAAAPLIWNLLQAFYTKFPEYASRDFGIFTESYGGHYGPAFAKYILDQNDAIDAGKRKGQKINMVALGLNNAWINPYDAYKGMIDFATENTHKVLMTKDTGKTMMTTLNQRCLPALKECWQSGTNAKCSHATSLCKSQVENRILMRGGFDVYDVRRSSRTGSFPPKTYQKFLRQPSVQSTIGAGKTFNECPQSVQVRFSRTGDGMSYDGIDNLGSHVAQILETINPSLRVW